MNDVREFIKEKGFDFEPELNGDFRNFKSNGQKGWYCGSTDGDKITFSFGTWAGEKYYFSNGYNGQADEKIEALKIKSENDKQAKNEETKIRAQKIWGNLKQSLHPYLDKKRLNEAFGSRTNKWNNRFDLMIPLYDNQGALWNLQIISESGEKKFLSGGRVTGLYHTIGTYKNKIYISEGFATAATVYMATQEMAVCAFNCHNLEPVYEAIKEAFPSAEIIIAADDDWSKPENAGVKAAQSILEKFGTKYVIPEFGSKVRARGPKDTDWNDLYIIEGLDAVRAQFKAFNENGQKTQEKTGKNTKSQAKTSKNSSKNTEICQDFRGLSQIYKEFNPKTKKYTPIFDKEVVDALLGFYGDSIIAQDSDVFVYNKTHWQLLNQAGENLLKRQINWIREDELTASKIENIYKLFLQNAPHPPNNLFETNFYRVNFLNGTLHVLKENGKWDLSFKPHSKKDFCTNVIPINYDESLNEQNEEFEDLLLKILGEHDFVNRRRVVAQMYGACLAPIFPRLFLIYGPAGTGKSTLIIGAQKLVHEDNWSSFEPTDIKDFTLEQALGKLINVVTDIDTTQPMKDSILKKVEDRVPIMINRKNKTYVQMTLPPVHIYGANEIPSTLEKGSGSHTRRWSFLELNTFRAIEGNYQKFLINDIFSKNPVGVLNFAVRGLKDLLDSKGNYFNTDAGKEKIRDWQVSNDPIGQFFDELKNGEVDFLRLNKDGEIKRSDLWTNYVAWYKDSFNKLPKLGKRKFLDRFFEHPVYAVLGLNMHKNSAGIFSIRGLSKIIDLSGYNSYGTK